MLQERPRDEILAPKSALELLHEHQKRSHIPLIPSAPSWLQLRPGHIYELSGPAGSGKTQLALNCCIHPARQKHQVYYLSLRGSQSTIGTLGYRLSQMCGGNNKISDVLSHIHLRAIHNVDDFLEVIAKLPTNARLVVIDSIADLFRTNDTTSRVDADYYQQRARSLWRVSQHLRRRNTTTTLVLNQVTATPGRGTLHQPALGLAWSQCVTSQLRIHGHRWIRLHHSPVYGPQQVQFTIATEGCRWVVDEENQKRARNNSSGSS